jgi:LmbE family N-acetylglucosaminyl deacetylase
MKAVLLSPHLDDAIMCLGGWAGTLPRETFAVTVATLFAGIPPAGLLSPAAHEFHQDCGLDDDAVLERRAEDLAAATMVGAKTHWLDILDAIYRLANGVPVYPSHDDLFGIPAPEEDELCTAAAGLLAEELPAPDALLMPLSVGGHVDHVLTRRIGEAFAATLPDNCVVGYYEESFYTAQKGGQAWERVDTRGLSPMKITVTGDTLDRKLAAIAAYASQVHMLGIGPDNGPEHLAFIKLSETERVWVRQDDNPTLRQLFLGQTGH